MREYIYIYIYMCVCVCVYVCEYTPLTRIELDLQWARILSPAQLLEDHRSPSEHYRCLYKYQNYKIMVVLT